VLPNFSIAAAAAKELMIAFCPAHRPGGYNAVSFVYGYELNFILRVRGIFTANAVLA
jgi:hypothetical protein